jgi:hypothetical protein
MKIANFIYSLYIFLVSVFQQQEDSLPEIVGDILEPEPLHFTFETIGWKVLAFLIIVIASVFLYKWLKLFRKNKYRREAIKKLQLIEVENSDSQSKINDINIILKQVAIVTFGREHVAELYGNDWFSFLDSKSKKSEFVKYSNNFTDAIYSSKTFDDTTLRTIYKLAKTWIHEHS